jgi:hypothetical protein
MKFTRLRLVALFACAFTFAFCMGFILPALGQVFPSPLPTEAPDSQFLMQLLASVGGLRGLGGFALALGIVQLLFFAVQTATGGRLLGKFKLLAVYLLSYVAGVLGLVVVGHKPWAAALFDTQALAAFSVFLHQAWKQFLEKPPGA